MTGPLVVIDMDEVAAEAEEMPLCDRCRSGHAVAVDADGTWAVTLSHEVNCPAMRSRFTSVPGGAA